MACSLPPNWCHSTLSLSLHPFLVLTLCTLCVFFKYASHTISIAPRDSWHRSSSHQPHESKPWNPWVAKVFYRRGFIETWGRGTLQIVKLMQDAGLTTPHVQAGEVTVSITFALPAQPKQEKSSEKSSEKILELLKLQPALSANALAEKWTCPQESSKNKLVCSKKMVNSAALAQQKAVAGMLKANLLTWTKWT